MASEQSGYHGSLEGVIAGVQDQGNLAAELKKAYTDQGVLVAETVTAYEAFVRAFGAMVTHQTQTVIPLQYNGLDTAAETKEAFSNAFPNIQDKLVLQAIAAGLSALSTAWETSTGVTDGLTREIQEIGQRVTAHDAELEEIRGGVAAAGQGYDLFQRQCGEVTQQLQIQRGNT